MQTIERQLKVLISLTLFLALFLLGWAIMPLFSNDTARLVIGILAIVFELLPLVMIAISKGVSANLYKKMNDMSVAEAQKSFLSHRENAKEEADKYFLKLKKIRINASVFALFIGLSGGISLVLSIAFKNYVILIFAIISLFWLYVAFSRISFRLNSNKRRFTNDKTYVDEKDYPHLFGLCKKAADIMGCKGKIKISVLPDCNAGIAKIGGYYSIQLGARLLALLNEEELYNVLLHEFAHVSPALDEQSEMIQFYNDHFGAEPNFIQRFYSGFDMRFVLDYMIYSFAVSILNETSSDEAMKVYGNAQAAASALIKLHFNDLYDWEYNLYPHANFFAEERPDELFFEKIIDEFLSTIPKRKDFWLELIPKEILARNASHPTLKMRLDTLGITDFVVLDAETEGDYRKECQKATKHVQKLLIAENKEDFAKTRRGYLESLEKIKQWELDGKPVVAEEYGTILSALVRDGRMDEAIELCDMAIEKLPLSGSSYAYYIKGAHMLANYDPSGIELIYKAVDDNKNYLEEGLGLIGKFCCITGRSEELDDYREKAVKYAQQDKDVYSKVGTLYPDDEITSDDLDKSLLENLKSYFKRVDNGKISAIYIVKKVITKDFSTSAVVVKFVEGAKNEEIGEVMDKIFEYLDKATDHQFSLFLYDQVRNVRVERVPGSLVYKKSV